MEKKISRKQAITYLTKRRNELELSLKIDCPKSSEIEKMFRQQLEVTDMAIQALKEQEERASPKPLTLKELRQMEGDVVWVVVIDPDVFCDPKDTFSDWGHVRKSWVRLWDASRADIITVSHHFEDYNKTWIAYRYQPDKQED